MKNTPHHPRPVSGMLICCLYAIKKHLFLSLPLILLLTEASAQLAALTEIPYTQMTNAAPDPHNVARTGGPYTATIGVSSDYTIYWAIIESETRDTIATGTGNSVSHTFVEADLGKAYDIGIEAYWGQDGLARYLRRGIRTVSYEVFDPADPDVTVIDVSTHSGYTTTPPATHKVLFTGTRTSGAMNINGWSIPGKTIVIQHQGQVELLDKWVFGHSNHNIIVDGCTDPDIAYGFIAEESLGGGDCFVIVPGQYGNTNYSDSIIVGGVKARYGTSGFHILPPEADPDGPPVTQLSGFSIFNCYAYKNDTEGYYLGYTRDYQGFAELLEPRYYYNVADSCGWDGLQPGNSVGVEAHNFEIIACGRRNNSAQWSGISMNGFSGIIHHTYIKDLKNSITGSTGLHHGQYHIFRNKIHSTLTQATTHCWSRLGDGADPSTMPCDLCIYYNEFDVVKEPFGTFCHGCSGTPGLNYHYDNNVQLNTSWPNPNWNASYFVNNPYTEHWMAAYDFDGYRSVTQPVQFFYALYNFGGAGTDPQVPGTISVWDATKSQTNEDYGDTGSNGVTVIAVNRGVGQLDDGPPSLNMGQYWGWKSGNTNKASGMTVTGTNLYDNDVLNSAWFSDNSPAGLRFEGLPNGTYTVKIVALVTNLATTREASFSVNGETPVVVQINDAATNNVLQSESQHMAVETGLEVTGGVIHIKMDVINSTYNTPFFMNAVEIIQTGF